MEIRVWGGGTNDPPLGDLSTANNWTADTVPVDGDEIVFDGLHGNAAITAGWATFAAISPAKVIVADEYTQSMGATANRIQFLNVGTFMYSGQGAEAWFTFNGTCALANVLDSGTGADALHLGGNTVTLLHLFKGVVTLQTGLTVSDAYVHFRTSQLTDVSLTVQSGVFLSRVYQRGGTVASESAAADIYKAAGTWTQTTGDVVNLLNMGGRFDWEAAAGTIGNASVVGGILDASGNAAAKTITDLYCWYGAETDLRNSAGNIIVTNPVQNLGGRIRADVGTQIAYA